MCRVVQLVQVVRWGVLVQVRGLMGKPTGSNHESNRVES